MGRLSEPLFVVTEVLGDGGSVSNITLPALTVTDPREGEPMRIAVYRSEADARSGAVPALRFNSSTDAAPNDNGAAHCCWRFYARCR